MGRATRTPHQVTFLVLICGVMAYALLQSLVDPGAADDPGAPAHHADGDHLAHHRIPALRLGLHADPRPHRRRVRQGADARRHARGARGRHGARPRSSNSIALLIVARLIQGAGGGVLPLAFGIIRDEFPREKVAGAIGLSAAMIAVGSGLGITVAGPIVVSPRLPLAVHHPALPHRSRGHRHPPAGTGVPGSHRRRGEHARRAAAVGVARRAAARHQRGPRRWGWTSPGILGLFAASRSSSASIWVRVEARAKDPLIDMQMMRQPAVWTTNLTALLLGVAMYSVMAFLPGFFQTPERAGLRLRGQHRRLRACIMLPSSVDDVRRRAGVRPLAARYGSKLPVIGGSVIAALTFLLMAVAHGVGLGDGARNRAHGARRRRCLLRAVEPRRRIGAGPPDRCGERHERQHPHDRRLDRQPGLQQPDHGRDHRQRAAEGVRLRRRRSSSSPSCRCLQLRPP